jgi:hypothetical protein
MPNGYLGALWLMWSNSAIEPAHVIKALSIYGYKLDALTKQGLVASNENTRFEYKEYTSWS